MLPAMDKPKFDIGIVVPLKEEFRYVTEVAPQVESIFHEGTHFYRLDFGAASAVCCLIDQMGPLAALQATSRLLGFADVKLLVLLGMAGAIDDDVAIGDVVIASEINEFQANSKAESAGDSYEVRYSGRHWPLEYRIREAVTHFEFSDRGAFNKWQAIVSNHYAEITIENKDQVCSAQSTLHLGPIASGNVVAASKAFVTEVKKINRKFLAIDMEAAGIASAASERMHPLPCLVVRGISDHADEKKKLLDKESKNTWRRYCVRNASSLLRSLLAWDGFLSVVGLESRSAAQTDSDLARQLVNDLKSIVGGAWAVGVAFGLYTHGPRILKDGVVVPTDLNRLRALDARIRILIDSLAGERQELAAHKNVEAAARAIEKLVNDFKASLASEAATTLLANFDGVIFEILFPEQLVEEIEPLLLEADRLENDVGPEAAVELLKGIASKHRLLRERYISALARANMWEEINRIVCQIDLAELSRTELENGIFACAKIGTEERAEEMIRCHERDYDDKAAKLFRERCVGTSTSGVGL
jgi:nucleoside phosphorylase